MARNKSLKSISLILLTAVMAVTNARAFYYTVTGTGDSSSSAPVGGSGLQSSPYQMTSLRGAILHANANGSGPHTISVPPGTYTLTLGELQIGTASGNITVTLSGSSAPAATVIQQSVSGTSRVFNLDPNTFGGVNVTLQNLTIAHGRNTDGFGGAGIICGYQGPQPDTTTVNNCVFQDNVVTGPSGSAVGGAIQNIGGTLSVQGCTFDSNSAGSSAGGAIYFDTHAPSVGTLQVANCTFTSNTAGAIASGGGAIYVTGVAGSSLSVANSSFQANRATGTGAGGGAIYKDGTAVLTLTGCSFVNNQVQGTSGTLNQSSGGAVNNNNGQTTLQFCRFAGNTTAAANKGSALYNAAGNGASVTANNNWWSSNTGPGSGVLMSGAVSTTPASWLQLRHFASPSVLPAGSFSTLTATFLTNSAGSYIAPANLTPLIGLPIAFGNAVGGTLSNPQTVLQSSGTATATFVAGTVPGNASATATVDGVAATASMTIPCPTITGTLSGGGTICVGSAALVNVSLSGGTAPYTVTLNNGGGTRTGSSPLTFTVSPTATTSYAILSAADTNGCPVTATNTVTVTVNPLPAVPAILPAPAVVLASSSGNQASGPAGAAGYAWTILNGTLTSAANLPAITYTAGTNGVVTLGLTVYNASGCSASSSLTVPSLPALRLIPAASTPGGVLPLYLGNADGSPVASNRLARIRLYTGSSPNLPFSNWTVLPNPLVLTNGLLRVDNLNPTNLQQFFRALETP